MSRETRIYSELIVLLQIDPGTSPSYIPRIYGSNLDSDPRYILMEFMEGANLSTLMVPKENEDVLIVCPRSSTLPFPSPLPSFDSLQSILFYFLQSQIANFFAAMKSFSFLPPTWGMMGCFESISLFNHETLQIDAAFVSTHCSFVFSLSIFFSSAFFCLSLYSLIINIRFQM